ncbi:contactin-associated protein-like 2 [Platysternon megacephalum]|uniref:Contactin-associated protein-like 2 n=1 Tax=Platysternon megacephalum TaxID=55544 RepID=A0A4D9EBJ8_9SAUR|nr:contactin-associated protein-like 2 [Platysternon megacephalum]
MEQREALCAGQPHESAQSFVPSFSTTHLRCETHSALPWFSDDSPKCEITVPPRFIQATAVVMSQDDAFRNVFIEPESTKSPGRFVLNFCRAQHNHPAGPETEAV